MIHDATIQVTCDEPRCEESVQVTPEYMYRDYIGKSGFYDTKDAAIEKKLAPEHGWSVRDGKHYCEAHTAYDEDEDE